MPDSAERRPQRLYPLVFISLVALSLARDCAGLWISSSCALGKEGTLAIAPSWRSDGRATHTKNGRGCTTGNGYGYVHYRRFCGCRSSVSRAALASESESSSDVPTVIWSLGPSPWGRDQRYRHRRSGGSFGNVDKKRARCRAGVSPTAMRMATDLYEVLSLVDTADDKEIKRAYRRKALKTHPDVNTSPNAKAEFAEVVNAYEVLSDGKKRQAYDQKRKYAPPFGRGRASAGGPSGSGAPSWGRSAYDSAREEASRRWRAQNPNPGEIDDSFGDILRDLFGGISAAGGRGVLGDLVDFLENRVEGFSSETSAEFEDLMSSSNLDEMEAELENTRLLLEQLQKRSRRLNRDRFEAEKEVSTMKTAKAKRVVDIDELDRQMAAVEKAAGIKARFEEIQGHVKRAQARLGRLERKVADLRRVGGPRQNYGDGSSRRRDTRSSSYSSSRASSAATESEGARRADGARRRSNTSSPTGDDKSGGSNRNPSRSENSGAAAKSPRPPSPRANRVGLGGRRRTDDPEVEAELARLKREMGL